MPGWMQLVLGLMLNIGPKICTMQAPPPTVTLRQTLVIDGTSHLQGLIYEFYHIYPMCSDRHAGANKLGFTLFNIPSKHF